MNDILDKLKDLESARTCILKCQEVLLSQMRGEIDLTPEEYLKEKTVYSKNKAELKNVNKKIEILNDAIDIIEEIGE